LRGPRRARQKRGRRGVGQLGEPFQTPTVVFDRDYFSRRDPEQLRASVWHMVAENKLRMPHYRWALTEDQVRTIVQYLKSLN